MATVIKIIGIVIALLGIAYLARPQIIKPMMEFFKKGRRVYFIAFVRFVLAIVFLLAASQCHHPRIIAVFGIIFIISGLLVIILSPEKIKTIFEWYLVQPLWIFRVLAVITLAIGALILYAA